MFYLLFSCFFSFISVTEISLDYVRIYVLLLNRDSSDFHIEDTDCKLLSQVSSYSFTSYACPMGPIGCALRI